jgi:hypothetical protein
MKGTSMKIADRLATLALVMLLAACAAIQVERF